MTPNPKLLKILAAVLLQISLGKVAPVKAANPEHVKRLLETKECAGCDLSGANLSFAILVNANLRGANLRGANLSSADLTGANLSKADLRQANLNQAYLTQANLDRTNLTGASTNGTRGLPVIAASPPLSRLPPISPLPPLGRIPSLSRLPPISPLPPLGRIPSLSRLPPISPLPVLPSLRPQPPISILDEPKPSQQECIELLMKLARGTPLDAAQLEQTHTLGQRCREVLRVLPDPKAPLPTATECINFMQLTFEALRQNNVGKLVDISAEQGRSLTRCTEIIESRYMPSGSMLPTLEINDRLLIDKTAYRSQLPQRGDLVLFQPTEVLRKQNFKEVFLKRIIGLPGEQLAVKNGLVYINGKPLQENYIKERPDYQFGPVVVPANQYFMLGDNRNNSYDSHYWGFVPQELLVGKALGIFCPVERQQIFDDSKLLRDEKKTALSALFRSSASVCAIPPDGRMHDRNSEGKTTVGAMNQAQQAFYLEREGFISNLYDLGLGIRTETKNYRYSIKA